MKCAPLNQRFRLVDEKFDSYAATRLSVAELRRFLERFKGNELVYFVSRHGTANEVHQLHRNILRGRLEMTGDWLGLDEKREDLCAQLRRLRP